MSDQVTTPGFPALTPLPYHRAVVQYLQAEEPDVWKWAFSAEAKSEYADQVRADLLKQTYRLDADAHPDLHARCATAAQRLGIDVPITLYQGADGPMNAALYFVPGEAHVVFSGPILERLHGAELEALLGHELSHYLLWQLDGGAFHTADRILGAAAHDARTHSSQLQTARLFRLYTEVFADRGGAVASQMLLPTVSALVKTQTGLATLSAEHYLKQADEICAPGTPAGDSTSHPEIFVRARALRLWCENDDSADAWLSSALIGPLALDQLDVLGQRQLGALTRRVMTELLKPRCLQSESMLAHARRFFPDFAPQDSADAQLGELIAAAPGVHDYFAYLLADFCVADRDLDNVPLAAAWQLSERLGLAATFERVVLKDLSVPKRQLTKLKQGAAKLLEKAEKQHG